MTKSQLKELIKECIVEVLAEGLRTSTAKLNESKGKTSPSKKQQYSQKKSPLDEKVTPFGMSNKVLAKAVNVATEDPVMSEMLRDAALTMQKQDVGDDMPGKDAAAIAMSNVDDVGKLFEGSNRWASMAFMPMRKGMQQQPDDDEDLDL